MMWHTPTTIWSQCGPSKHLICYSEISLDTGFAVSLYAQARSGCLSLFTNPQASSYAASCEAFSTPASLRSSSESGHGWSCFCNACTSFGQRCTILYKGPALRIPLVYTTDIVFYIAHIFVIILHSWMQIVKHAMYDATKAQSVYIPALQPVHQIILYLYMRLYDMDMAKHLTLVHYIVAWILRLFICNSPINKDLWAVLTPLSWYYRQRWCSLCMCQTPSVQWCIMHMSISSQDSAGNIMTHVQNLHKLYI